jgi:predicted ArsR family transcriptional regulator
MNNITMTGTNLMVDGKVVASISDFSSLRDALFDKLTRTEAVYLAVALMGEARTVAVAELLDMDKANATKRLLFLEEEGRVEVIDDCHTLGKPGRPSRVWAIAE